jgi:hypothetical protein
MCDCKKIRVDESYTSFKNIDCFTNACTVIDNLLRILENSDKTNVFWDKFVQDIPEAYHLRDPDKDPRQTLLYKVCLNAPYIMEFFEDIEDEQAMDALEKCVQECC